MGRKSKVSKELKVKACKDYLSGKKSLIKVARALSVNVSSVKKWISKYKIHGETALSNKPTNSSYTASFKQQVVDELIIPRILSHV